MIEISLVFAISAFSAGVAMFLAPCTFPIVPAFLASMVPDTEGEHYDREMLLRTIVFTVGFGVVFTLFGVLSGFLGSTLIVYKSTLSQIGAVAIIIFGLALLGVFDIPILKHSFQRLRVPIIKKGRVLRPAFLGVVFALGWSPCAGPLLVSILLLASQTGTVLEGGILLAIFSLGLAVPFIFVGSLYAYSLRFFNIYEKYYKLISTISGLLLLVLGISLLFTQTIIYTQFGYMLYDAFGIVPMCSYY